MVVTKLVMEDLEDSIDNQILEQILFLDISMERLEKGEFDKTIFPFIFINIF